MKVLVLIESLGRGGAESCLAAGLPALSRYGIESTVVTLGGPHDLAGELRAEGISVHEARSAREAFAIAMKLDLDVIHTHLFRANILGRIVSATRRVPLITTLHNPDYSMEGYGQFRLRFLTDALTSRLVRSRFVAVSEVVRDDYARHLGVEAVVIPNPLAPFWFRAGPPRQLARQQLRIDRDETLILAVGRLHRQKGFDTLEQAMTDPRLASARCVVIGKGPDGARLRVSGRLEIVEPMPHERLELWLAAADVIAVPSRYESFGVFAAEALARGKPLVVTDIPGLSSTVGEAAVRIPREDPRALADGIFSLLNNHELRESLCRKGPGQVTQFAVDHWASRIHQEYVAILG